jgi:hypothetical protein
VSTGKVVLFALEFYEFLRWRSKFHTYAPGVDDFRSPVRKAERSSASFVRCTIYGFCLPLISEFVT